jgi:branched-chain amino acid transport system ATP-binding protein
MNALLSIDGVSKRFRGLLAVDNASFRVSQGSIFAVIGPNGAGKTTLFNIIAGVLTPDQGSITFAGQRVDGLRSDEICRRGIGRTFQLVRPFPALSVEDNVIVGAMLHRPDLAAARARAHEVLRRLDLFGKRDQLASALTLPDRKRLEVARALATDPKLLLLDEVMAGLRPAETDRIVAILTTLNRETGLTILLIEHVMRAVMALAERVLVLHHGAAIARRPARRRGARAGRDRILSGRGGGRLMLRVEHLDVFHGDAQALDDVSIEIGEGMIVAIVGANGAGKTSLIRPSRHASARARAHRVPQHRYRRLGEPPRLQSRDRPGGGRPAGVSHAVGRREPRHGRNAPARPRGAGEKSGTGVGAVSRAGRNGRGKRRARCQEASSRCWRSAAA